MRKICAVLAIFFSFLLPFSYNASADNPPAAPAAPAAKPPSARYITGPELEQMMNDGKKLAIIDIRDNLYYRGGHIPGAINVSSDTAYNKRDLTSEYQPKDRVVVVGYGGTTGQEIIDMFLEHGFENVYGLKGGMREWKGQVVK